MKPRPAHYIDLAAYRRHGIQLQHRRPPATIDWLKLTGWLLALALGISFYIGLYLVIL